MNYIFGREPFADTIKCLYNVLMITTVCISVLITAPVFLNTTVCKSLIYTVYITMPVLGVLIIKAVLGKPSYEKNTKNWYTIDAQGAISAIFWQC